jgi:aldose 1-epimerase
MVASPPYDRRWSVPLKKDPFGNTPDGKAIERYTFANSHGLRASAMSWGAMLLAVVMPDMDGRPAPITLSFDTPEEYEKKHAYLGSTVGRFGNRIARGSFTLDGKKYTLAVNDHANHLHGGIVGFDRVLWRAEGFEEPGRAGVRMHYLSGDGEEGYPGNLDVTVTFSLTEEHELTFQYDARTDAPTPVNLTNHAYWNLAGAGSGTIEGQELELACPRYLPVTDELLPTGEVKSARANRLGMRSENRPLHGHLDHDGRDPALHWQLPRGGAGLTRKAVPPARRLLPRDGALPRLRQPPGVSLLHPTTGPGLPPRDPAPVLGQASRIARIPSSRQRSTSSSTKFP